MAMIKCPGCGQEVSEKAKKCPKCGHRFSKKIPKKVIIVIVLVICCILVAVGIMTTIKQNERKKQEEIQACLANVQQYYNSGEFAKVFDEFNKLDQLGYDTQKQREIAEYDQKVYYVAKKFNDALSKVDKELRDNTYLSLRGLLNGLKEPIADFDNLEINKDSKIGAYIDSVQKDVMYTSGLKDTVENDEYDLDNWITQSVYSEVIKTYTSGILKAHKFPYGG